MAIDKFHKTKWPGLYRLPDGRWYIRAAVKVDGKTKQLKKILAADVDELDVLRLFKALKEQVRNPQADVVAEPAPPVATETVEQYATRWLRVRVDGLKPSTRITYENALSQHVLPRLGHLPCNQVTRQVVEAWTKWALRQEQTRSRTVVIDGVPVQETYTELYRDPTVRQWWRILKPMLKDMAADHGLPDSTLRTPKMRDRGLDPVREQRTLDLDMGVELLEAAREHTPDRYAEILCLLLTGMRPGEMYALRWDRINLETGEAYLRAAVSAGELTGSTKTGERRWVPLHEHLVQTLREHRSKQLERLDKRELDTGLMFPSAVGTPRTPNSLDKAFLKLGKVLGTDINLGNQVLRRSLNTNLIDLKEDRLVVRAIVGHTTEEMTERYHHASATAKMEAVSRMPVRRRRADSPQGTTGEGTTAFAEPAPPVTPAVAAAQDVPTQDGQHADWNGGPRGDRKGGLQAEWRRSRGPRR